MKKNHLYQGYGEQVFWIALLLLGTVKAGMGTIPKTVTIPGDAYTAYDVPAGGSALQLNINRANTNLVIDDSEILLQDSSDDVQWYRSSANSATHVYQIGTVLSAREYLRVFGHYHYLGGTGGGGGSKPTFNARVAAPDVDMVSLTEEQEESVGVWIGKGGARKAVTVSAVQCRGPSSQQTLSWSSGKLSLWTASTGGSILPGGSKTLSASQNYTYYAQGDIAGGSIRDSYIATAYTVSGQGTAQDKVNLTVAGAEIGAFDTILLNATNDVTVTLAPNPPGITSVLQIVCLNGSGSAQFVPSGGTTSNITQSASVKIKGVTTSSTVSNMILRAMFGSDVLASNVFSVVGMQSPLQYKMGTNTWANMSDPIYVCKDTTVDFKAIKSPTNAPWPSGKPIWGGVVSGSGVETNSYTFSTVSTNDSDYKLVTAECGNIVTGRVMVAGLVLKEVSFGKHNVMRSDDGAFYPTPHWTLTNDVPVLYVRNTNMATSAKFEASLSNFTGTVMIKGDGPGDLDIPETMVSASGGIVSLPQTDSTGFFTNTVDFLDKMEIEWLYATVGSTNYNQAGVSSNQVYVCLDEPGAVLLYHTVVQLACSVGHATSADEAVSNSWSQLTGTDFTTWDGKTLYYYKPGVNFDNTPQTVSELLSSSNGSCYAWMRLFGDALLVNGINSTQVEVTSPTNDCFLVKDWNYGTPSFTNTPPHNWKLQFATNDVDMVPVPPGSVYGDLTSLSTLEGQHSSPPSEKVFGGHYILKYNGLYYDPSYGVTYASTNDFQANAVDGYANDLGDSTTNYVIFRAKQVSITCEISFTEY